MENQLIPGQFGMDLECYVNNIHIFLLVKKKTNRNKEMNETKTKQRLKEKNKHE